jgi:hypothetical protein
MADAQSRFCPIKISCRSFSFFRKHFRSAHGSEFFIQKLFFSPKRNFRHEEQKKSLAVLYDPIVFQKTGLLQTGEMCSKNE